MFNINFILQSIVDTIDGTYESKLIFYRTSNKTKHRLSETFLQFFVITQGIGTEGK